MIPTRYLIRPMKPADLPLIKRWRTEHHVRRWWGEPDVELAEENAEDPRIDLWVAELNGRPFAFIQDYDVHGWHNHHFSYLPAPSRGLDLFIGEADLIGAGHGSALVRQHVDALFTRGLRAAGIDPHPDNVAAQRAFTKAGFNLVGGPVKTAWNLSMLMERRAPT